MSHSSRDVLQAVALKKWLVEQNPPLDNDIFLDVDENFGIRPGIKWKDALQQASMRCEAVICLLSRNWEQSRECNTEFRTAENLNKRIFCARLEPETGKDITGDWQWVDLFVDDGPQTTIDFTYDHKPQSVSFSTKGLRRLGREIIGKGIGADTFVWPPPSDPERAPYRGWEPLQEVDAAIFYGRDAQLVRGLDALRGMRQSGATLFVILGPSGAGKSSFLRAGLMPRLRRDDRTFVALEIVRPGRNVLTGEEGLARSIQATLKRLKRSTPIAEIKDACLNDADKVGRLLYELQQAAVAQLVDLPDDATPPTLVLPVDQAEELFGVDAGTEAQQFLEMIGRHARTEIGERVPLIVAMTMRTDHHEALQTADELRDVKSELFGDLKPLPQAEFKEVIEAPARRATEGGHPLIVEPALVERLLADCTMGADTLPLLSLTLARLYTEYGDDGDLLLSEYLAMGEMRKVVQTEVDKVLSRDESARNRELELLRGAFIPHLATINPDNDKPVRRVAKWSDLPAAAKPLLDEFVAKRLLVTGAGGNVVEVALESLLQHWDELRDWLTEERETLKQAEVLKRDADAWEKHSRNDSYLLEGERLTEAENLQTSRLQDHVAVAREFIEKSREREHRRTGAIQAARRRSKILRGVLAAAVVVALLAAFAGWQLYDSFRHNQGLRLVVEAEQMLRGGRTGGDVLALQTLLAAGSLKAPTAGAVANARRDEVRIMENPKTQGTEPITPVRGVAVSPEGREIASASDDHTVRVWDSGTGMLLRSLDVGDPDKAVSVAFSADGKLIVTGSSGGIVQVWDVNSGKPFGGRIAAGGVVSSVVFSPDGATIASASSDGYVRVWETVGGRPLANVRASQPGFRSVAFSQDGGRLVSGDDDGYVRLWDPRTGKEIAVPRLMGDHITVMSVAFSPPDFEGNTGDRVAAGLYDGRIQILNGATLDPVGQPFVAHPDIINSVAFSPGGSRIVSGGADNTVRVWNSPFKPTPQDPIGRPIGGPLIGHHGQVLSVSFNSDTTRIVSGGQDGSVRVWDAITALPMPANQGEVRTVAVRPDGKEMASGGTDGTIKLWNPATAAPTGQFGVSSPGYEQTINSLAFSPDGGSVVAGGNSGVLQLWNLATPRKPDRTRDLPDVAVPTGARIMSVAYSPDGSRVVTGCFDGSLSLWDGHTLKLIARTKTDGYQLWSVAFSPDGRRIVTGSGFDSMMSEANLIQLWSVDPLTKDGDPMKSSGGANIYGVAFSPDGTRVASGDSDGTTRLWDVGTRHQVGPAMTGDQNAVTSVDFAHDHSWIVAGAGDGKVRLWNEGDFEPIGTPIEGHQNSVIAVFSPDDKWILSGSVDGNLHLWPASQDLTSFICDKLNSNMSEKQWDKTVSWWIPYRQGCPGLPIAPS
ncbi:nSTAND1 domain-containing NTPase [Mycolicibacterium sp. Dal123E01]|uniref:nSTAND1 domain-containing NTPase n=1 Tax=Mycolicibacterium sp. Dal123E01 TaxID=3457578 RepID=UPI00403EC814